MKPTREQLKGIFPWASKAFLDANASPDPERLPAPIAQPPPVVPLERVGEREAPCSARVTLRFDVHASRPTDSDNARVKELIDGLRHAGILVDDDWKHVAGTCVFVHKAPKGEEKTVITITPHP